MAQFVQYMLNYDNVGGIGYCNDYPIFTMKADGNSGESAPLNPVLIGKGNVFRIEITELGENPSLKFGIQGAEEGDVVNSMDGDEIDLSGDLPISVSKTFDSTQDDFRGLLETCQPSDVETMTALALKIRDTINSGDKTAIATMLEKKFTIIAKVMGIPPESVAEMTEGMSEELASNGIKLEAEDLALVPCCDNRLWQLKRKDGQDLILVEEEDGSMSVEATAALTADGPAIVL